MMEGINLATGGTLGLLVALTSLLVRVLLKTDDRWARIVERQAKELVDERAMRQAAEDKIHVVELERDRWRERYLSEFDPDK